MYSLVSWYILKGIGVAIDLACLIWCIEVKALLDGPSWLCFNVGLLFSCLCLPLLLRGPLSSCTAVNIEHYLILKYAYRSIQPRRKQYFQPKKRKVLFPEMVGKNRESVGLQSTGYKNDLQWTKGMGKERWISQNEVKSTTITGSRYLCFVETLWSHKGLN